MRPASFALTHQLAVKVLQDVERLLLLTRARDQPFAVIEILYARQRTARRAEVRQYPRRHSAQRRDAPQHSNLVLVNVALILLGPPRALVAVMAEQRVA